MMNKPTRETSSLFGGLMMVSLLCYVVIISAFLVSVFFPARDIRDLLYDGFEHRAETLLGALEKANHASLAQVRQAMLEQNTAPLDQTPLLKENLDLLEETTEFTPATRERLKARARKTQAAFKTFALKARETVPSAQDDAYLSLVKESAMLQNQLDQAREALGGYRQQQRLALGQRESLMMLVLGLFGFFGGLSIVIITRSFKIQVWTPVSNILRYTQRLEQGDLSADLAGTTHSGGVDELGKIARAVKGLGKTIRNIFLAIQSHGADAGHIAASLDDRCRKLIDVQSEELRGLENIQTRLQDSLSLSEDFKTGAHDAQHYAAEVAGRFADLQLGSQQLQEHAKELNQSLSSGAHSAEGLTRNADQVFADLQRVRDGLHEGLNGAESLLSNISEMTGQAGRIFSAVDETGAVVEEMMAGNQQVMENIRSMDQNMDVAFREIEALLLSIRAMDGRIRESAAFSHEVAKTAQEGSQIVEQAIEKMREIKQMVSTTAKQIKDLGNSTQEITNVVSTITGLAEQTNLLALNAAIEAARAGEEGEGFAVVADKVRHLAEQSSRSAKEIENHITEVQQETEKVVQGMVDWGRQVEEGVAHTDEAGKKIGTIVEKVRHANLLMKEISTTTQEQAKRSDKVKQVVDRLTTANQAIRASVQEQEVGGRRMTEAIVTLRDTAQHLKHSAGGQEDGAKGLSQMLLHQREAAESIHRRMSDHRQVCGLLQRHLQAATRAGGEIGHLTRQQADKHRDLLTAGEHVAEETRRLADRSAAELVRTRQVCEELKTLSGGSKQGLGLARTVHDDSRVLATTVQQLLDILVDFRLETPAAPPVHGQEATGLKAVEAT